MKSKTLVNFTGAAGMVAMLCSVALSARADYPSTVESLGPAAYYRLNETVAPPAADVATNLGTAGARGNAYYYNAYNNPGGTSFNYSSNATHGAPGALAGRADTAAAFDGGGNYVMMAMPDTNKTLSPQGAFTAEAWVKPTTTGNYETPLSFSDFQAPADGWWTYAIPGGGWYLIMYAGTPSDGYHEAFAGGGGPAITTATLAAGTWYHLAIVYDGTNGFLYVNGAVVASGPAPYTPNTVGQLTIGARSYEGSFFPGSIDEVALYTNALTAADILAHYQNGTNATASESSYPSLVLSRNPLLYYRLDEPTYTAPNPTSLPVATNLGTLGPAANGRYIPGTTPGAAGPGFSGVGGGGSRACLFNGASGYAVASGLGTIPQTISVMCWFKANVLERNRGYDLILAKGDSAFDVQRGDPTQDYIQFDTFRSAGGADSLFDTVSINDGRWHHLTVVYSNDATSLYLDGALNATGTAAGTVATGLIPLAFGESIENPGRVWNGLISEVAVFTNALSALQVQSAYNSAGVPPIIVEQPQAPGIVYNGSTFTLAVAVEGSAPLSFQWKQNAGALSGQTNASLTLTGVSAAADNGSYTVVVSNSYGAVTSSVVVINVAADYGTTVINLNPVGYYRLNETAQPPAADIATNLGAAGALGNAYYYHEGNFPAATAFDPSLNATHGVPGALAGGGSSDTAVAFDGGIQFIMMPLPDTNNALNPQVAFTAEAWANPAVVGANEPILSFGDYSGNRDGWLIYLQTTGWELRMYQGVGGNLAAQINSGSAPNPGVWYHVVAVYDGTNAYLYTNGVLAGQQVPAGYVPNKLGAFTIGARSDEGFLFPGSEDEVALYTNALSAAEILAHYRAGTNAASTPSSYPTLVLAGNPLLYYRLDEPPYTQPDPGTLPVATNLGTLGSAANGSYIPGTTPGEAGPSFLGLGGTNNLACLFNGASGYVAAGDLGAVPQTLSVMCWFKANVLERNRGYTLLLAKGDTSYDVQRGDPTLDIVQFDTIRTAGGADSLFGTVDISDGRWHHLAAVYNSGATSLYFDGMLNATGVATGTLATGVIPLTIGESIENPGRVWHGLLSEVAIFTNVLTGAQIEQAYDSAGVPPYIVQQPQAPATVYEASTVALSVGVQGAPPFSYQWMYNTQPLPRQTNASLVLTNVSAAANNGNYVVVVTNPYGSVTSTVVGISVVAGPPAILQQPASATRAVGGHVTFSVAAGGTAPLSYQWSKGGSTIAGATQSSLTFDQVQAADAGSYVVTITNPHGSTNSVPATLTVLSLSSNNNYSKLVMSFRPFVYWPLNETNGGIAADIAGGFDGVWQGAITNDAGAQPPSFGGFDSNHPSYLFNGTNAWVLCPQLLNLNPSAQTLTAWIKANPFPSTTVHDTILGKGAVSFRLARWNSDETLEYSINNTLPSPYTDGTAILDDGNWHLIVAVYDNGEKRLYTDGNLDVAEARYGLVGTNADPVAIGNNTFGVTWFWNGWIADVALFNRGLSGAEASNLWQLAVNGATAPVIGVQPAPQTVYVGQSAVFEVIASAGAAPFTYQWRKGGAPIPGATDQNFTIPAASYADTGSYDVLVSNTVSFATSLAAELAVVPPASFADLTNGLVLHLKFDNTYADSSGHGNNGVQSGSPTFVAGKIGTGAVHVNTVVGSTYNYVSVPYSADFAFDSLTSFSVAYWTRYTGDSPNLPMVGAAIGSTTAPGWVLTDDNGLIAWSLVASDGSDGARVANPVPASPVLNDGMWHHLALTVDRSNDRIATYVDGVQIDSEPVGSLATIDATNGIVIGQDPSGTYGVNGAYDIDDLGIWKRALAPVEAESIYAAGQRAQSFDAVGPVVLSTQYSGGTVEIAWQAGTLQSATDLNGPWTSVTNAFAPSYLVTPSGAQMFYRVKQ
jgi:hypothetical protein